MIATGLPRRVRLAFSSPTSVTRAPVPVDARTATVSLFAENAAPMPPGSWSTGLYVVASTTVTTSDETRSARSPFGSATTCRGATATAFVVSSFLLELLSTTTAPEGDADCGVAGSATAMRIRPFAGSTWSVVGVPVTSIGVWPISVFVFPSISERSFWLGSKTNTVFACWFNASVVGRPPTSMLATSMSVVALSAPTLPASGYAR